MKVFGAVEDVRLICNKQTGESRGFAFVEFPSVEEAQRFIAYCQGTVEIDGEYVEVTFSSKPGYNNKQRDNQKSSNSRKFDWACPSCSYKNFARRGTCLHCSTEKPEEEYRYEKCPFVNGGEFLEHSNVLFFCFGARAPGRIFLRAQKQPFYDSSRSNNLQRPSRTQANKHPFGPWPQLQHLP